MKKICFCLSLVLLMASCKEKSQVPLETAGKSDDSGLRPGEVLSTATVTALTYVSSSHTLHLNLEYKACQPIKHSVSLNICAESYPLQCPLKLVRPATIDESCSKVIHEELDYALPATLDMAYVSVSDGKGGTKQVLVDKTGKGAPIAPGESNGGAAPVPSGASIVSLVYDAPTHSLKIGLDYSGCEIAAHGLIFSEFCAQSYPQQCSATLTQVASFDESCRTNRHEDMVYPLSDNQDAMVLTLRNKSSIGKSVLIDRTGKVKAATTPP